jgi:bla regulator protein BlaR1
MMHSPFFLPDSVVQALGWTLVHTLWQGTAIALVLWFALPRLSSARQRYRAAYGALMSLGLVAAGTFAWVYAPAQPQQPGTVIALAGEVGAELIPVSPELPEWIAGKLEGYHPVIVAVWLSGFLFFLLRLAAGLHYVHRLRRRQTQAAPAVWQERLCELATHLGVSRPIVLLESALVRVPMALGFFKPLILLPVGIANYLSPAEVEAVLAHELAHLARRDWLFNLLQTFVEAVFYFHPAVWWMAAMIRAERENCCDDVAVALTGNRLAYAKTLAHLQTLAVSPVPVPALGLSGSATLLRRRPLLLERIKRILHQPQPPTTAMEKTIVVALLAALAAFFTLRANTPPALVEAVREIVETPKAWFAPPAPPAEPAWQTPVSDTLPPAPKATRKVVHEDGDQVVEIQLEGDRISKLVIDGKEIPPAEYDRFSSLTENILRDATPPPPAPPAPPDPPMPSETPRAQWAPHAPRSSTISTQVDDQCNTIIRLEKEGKPVEIRVKDKEVWVDGRKLEKGEKLDMPGVILWDDDGHNFHFEHFFDGMFPAPPDAPTPPGAPAPEPFYFEIPHGQGMQFQHFNMSKHDLDRIREEALRSAERQHREIERELRQMEKERGQNRREWNKAREEERKALEEARRALEKAGKARHEALREMADEQRKVRAEMDEARRLQQREYRSQQSTSDFLKNNLLRDKLISDPDNFSMELSGKALRVNGKKQPEAVHQRYLELYQGKTGKSLDKKDTVRIEVVN